MKKQKGEWAWTEHREVFIPDIKLSLPLPKNALIVPNRGYAHTACVIAKNGDCIGWVPVERNPVTGTLIAKE